MELVGGYGAYVLFNIGRLRKLELIRRYLLFFRGASHAHIWGNSFQTEKMANVNLIGEGTAEEQRGDWCHKRS